MYWTRVDRNSPFRCNFMAFDLLSPILSAGGGKKGRTLSGNQNFPGGAAISEKMLAIGTPGG
jgi:hypothetical protein